MSIQLSNTCSQSDYFISNTKLMSVIYSSGVGEQFKLSNSALIVLFALCYHFNGTRNDSFPSQQFIATKTGLSLSSIKRSIKELLEKGLILKCRSKYGNIYKFTNKFFEAVNLTPEKAQNKPQLKSKMTPVNHEQTNNNKLNKITSFLNKTERSPLNQMVQYKFWKHKNTGQIMRVKPDIGNHLLIKIDSVSKMVLFIESGFCDSIDQFEPIQKPLKEKKIKHYPKKEIIKHLEDNGNIKQAEHLTKLWKMNKIVDKN